MINEISKDTMPYIKKTLSDEEIKKHIDNVDVSFKMEGIGPSDLANGLFAQYAKGEITEEQAIDTMRKNITNKLEK